MIALNNQDFPVEMVVFLLVFILFLSLLMKIRKRKIHIMATFGHNSWSVFKSALGLLITTLRE